MHHAVVRRWHRLSKLWFALPASSPCAPLGSVLGGRHLVVDHFADEIKMTAADSKRMNTNDSVKAGGTVVYVPFLEVALVSVLLLIAGYAIYRFLTAGNSF